MNKNGMEQYIERTPFPSEPLGYPRLVGHRISVVDIVQWSQKGTSPEQIAETHELELAAVHAVLAFYEQNREEIDRHIREGDAFFEAGLRAQEHDPIYQGLKARREAVKAALSDRQRQILNEASISLRRAV